MNILLYILIGIIIISLLIIFIRYYINRAIHKNVLSFQTSLMEKYIDEVEDTYNKMRGFRHDYHNHIAVMKAYLETNELAELDKYLIMLNENTIRIDSIVKTGNVTIDAILNPKLSVMKANDIRFDIKVIVPKKMQVSDFDLCVILGNLLDNTYEACIKIEDKNKRYIRIYIDIMKSQLYISIMNLSGDIVNKKGSVYHSTKGIGRGFGLIRIDNIVKKYNGYINRQSDVGVFVTEIMLPL